MIRYYIEILIFVYAQLYLLQVLLIQRIIIMVVSKICNSNFPWSVVKKTSQTMVIVAVTDESYIYANQIDFFNKMRFLQ